MEVSFEAGYFGPGSPPVAGRGGRTRFTWLDGEFFLIQRFAAGRSQRAGRHRDHPAPVKRRRPSASITTTRGGVARICQMSLNDGVWKLWREACGFWRRYTGVFSGDGRTIKGAWEGSAEGSQWKHDFDLNYVRPG